MASQEELNNQQKLNDLLRERRGIEFETLQDVRDFTNILQDQARLLEFQSAERRNINSISRKLQKIAQENFSILERELGTSKLSKSLKEAQLDLQREIAILGSKQNSILSDDAELNANILGTIEDTLRATFKLYGELSRIEKESEAIANSWSVKVLGGIKETVKTIPGFTKLAEPFREAEEAARQQVILNQKIKAARQVDLATGKGLNIENIKALGLTDKLLDKNGKIIQGAAALKRITSQGLGGNIAGLQKQFKLPSLIAGVKNLGASLSKALGPLYLIAELVSALRQSDRIVGNMAKGLNLSYKESLGIKQELTQASLDSENIYVTARGMAETFMFISKTLGTNVRLNEKDLVTFTKLRKMAGLTNEELQGIYDLSLTTNSTLEDSTKEFMAQVKTTSLLNGVVLNEKDILSDISKVSAATTLSLGKNPKQIAEAVTQAKALGFEMAKVEAIASNLLDFESSIENELQAELLLGRNITLEKARQAALNNDLATLSQEISKQLGDSAKFGELNFIQQEALAKSVGLSREELAKSLFIQDKLKGASGEEAAIRKKILNDRIKEVGLEAAQNELREQGWDTLQNQVSTQERFNQSVAKLRELFVVVAEAILPMAEALTPLIEGIGKVVKMLAPFMGTILGAVGGFAAGGPLGSLIGGITGAAMDFSRAGDLMYDANNNTTKISPKEGGLIELSQNDDVIAAPNLIKSLKNNNNNQPQVVQVVNDNKETNRLLAAILEKEGTIRMDVSDVGTAFSVSSYQIQ